MAKLDKERTIIPHIQPFVSDFTAREGRNWDPVERRDRRDPIAGQRDNQEEGGHGCKSKRVVGLGAQLRRGHPRVSKRQGGRS